MLGMNSFTSYVVRTMSELITIDLIKVDQYEEIYSISSKMNVLAKNSFSGTIKLFKRLLNTLCVR